MCSFSIAETCISVLKGSPPVFSKSEYSFEHDTLANIYMQKRMAFETSRYISTVFLKVFNLMNCRLKFLHTYTINQGSPTVVFFIMQES